MEGPVSSLQVDIVPAQGEISVGESKFFLCTVTGEADLITWFSPSGDKIETGQRISVVRNDDLSSTLTVYSADIDDAGTYKCVATFDGNESQATVNMKIFQKLTFRNAPSPQEYNEGDDAVIICDVTSSPPPNVIWKHRSREIIHKKDVRFSVLSNNYLQIRGIKKSDEGTYRCEGRILARGEISFKDIQIIVNVRFSVLSNNYLQIRGIKKSDEGTYRCEGRILARGEISFKDIQIIVNVPPAIRTRQTELNATSDIGQSVTLVCDADGFPEPAVSWASLDGNVVVRSDGRVSSLTLKDIQYTDAGQYVCTARSSIGQDSQSMFLEVHLYTENLITITGLRPDSRYELRMSAINGKGQGESSESTVFKTEPVLYTENLITITGLRPDSRYELRMSAINGKGQGESSESTVFKTEPVQYKLLSVLLLSYAPVSKSPLVEEIDFSLMNYNPPQANQFTKEFKAHQLKSAFMKGDRISFFGARRLFSANEEHENAQGGALVESEEDTQGDEQQSSTNLLEEDKEDLEQAVVTYVEELSSGADDIPVEPTEGDEAEVSSIPLITTAPVDVVVATDLPTEPTEGETESAESEEEPLHPSAAGDPQGEAFSAAESLVLLHTEQTADELTTAEADVLPVVVTDGGTHVQEVKTVQMTEKEMDATEEATVETTGSEGAIEGTAILMQLDHVPESTEPGRGAGPLTERPPATEESPTEKPGVVQMGGLGTVPSEVVSELATGAPVEPPAEHPTGMPVNLILEEYTVGTALPTVETDGIVPVVYITEVTEVPVGGQVEKISTEAAAGEIESITAAQEEQSLQATKALASQELITRVTVSTTQLILEETGANVFKFIMTAEPTDSGSGNPPETTVASAFTTQSATPVSGDPVEDREPSPPKLEGKAYESGNTLKVNWIKQDDGGSPIRHYLVRYRAKQMDDWKPEIRLPADSEYAILGGLEWNTEYEVYVVAENQQGKSRPSTLFFRTVPEPTSMPDEMASGSGLGTGAIVGILIIVFIILLVVVDVTCYFLNKCGVLMCIAVNVCGKPGPGAKGKDMEEGKAAFSKDESKEPIVEVRTEDEHTPNHDGGNLTEPNETTPLTEPEHPADTTATVEDMIPSVATNSDTITESFATAQNSPSSETTTLTSSITAPATTPVQQASTPKAGVTSPTSPAPASTEAASKVAPLVDLSDAPAANSPAAPSPNPTNAPKAPTATKTQAPAAPPEAVSIPTPAAEPPKPKTDAVKSPENEAAQPNAVMSPTEAAKNPTSPKNPSAPDSNAKPSQNEDFRVDLDLAKDVFAVWGNDPPPAVNQAAVPAPAAADSTKPSTPAKDEYGLFSGTSMASSQSCSVLNVMSVLVSLFAWSRLSLCHVVCL
ncbi:UNVERIFIED_CONTAM: hypothetical protein FKN15_006067 [Acipenser sinensis]